MCWIIFGIILSISIVLACASMLGASKSKGDLVACDSGEVFLEYCEKFLKQHASTTTFVFNAAKSGQNDNKFFIIRRDGDVACVARISFVYTPQLHRGRGYAKTVLSHLVLALLGKEISPILYTLADREDLVGLYRGIGFKIIDYATDLSFSVI